MSIKYSQEMSCRITEDLKRLSFENHDYCVKCGCSFENGDTTHLGYNVADEPLYVCDDCASQLKETAIRYSFSRRPFDIPSSETRLWRYMDFAKYVNLLASQGLYFSRADMFDDICEGAKGVKRNKKKWDEYFLNYFRSALGSLPEGYVNRLSDQDMDLKTNKLLKQLENGGLRNKRCTFINCWHENELESEAMWRLYSSHLENAIVIKTSFKKLYLSMGRNPDINIGRVKYINLQKEYAGVNDSFWRKRKSFEHEKEVSAIFIDHMNLNPGKIVPCDLSVLIEEVFVSPKSPSWFVDTVNDINEKYGIGIKVSPSQLNEEPFF
jgi:hypothetical protein